MKGKMAFFRAYDPQTDAELAQRIRARVTEDADALKQAGINCLRVYDMQIEGRSYLFAFVAAGEAREEAVEAALLAATGILSGWTKGRHVYEFKLHPGDTYDDLQSQGIVIGVREGMLDEYIRLHDEQPQIIHDLCYQNGFRKSSIFVVDLHKTYLLQFQDFSGEENPELYEDPIYQEWLRVTGECQDPLPGEKFWKLMRSVVEI